MKGETIRVLVVDDEPLARKFIRRMLRDEPGVEVCGECGTGRDAAESILCLAPDLVFLDVQMPELDGFAVIEAVGAHAMPAVVFTTAYDQYAVRAFESGALDYLLKPFDQMRFSVALARARERLRAGLVEEERQRLASLLDAVKAQRPHLERLIIKAGGRILFLRAEEIDWIEADDKYAHLHAGKRSHMVRQTLSALESQLDPRKFLRIHRSAIVNVERVKELRPLVGGEHAVILEGGAELTLSRGYRQKLFELLGRPL